MESMPSPMSQVSDVYSPDFDTMEGPALDQSEEEDQDRSPYHSDARVPPSGSSSSSSTDAHVRLTREAQRYDRLMRAIHRIPADRSARPPPEEVPVPRNDDRQRRNAVSSTPAIFPRDNGFVPNHRSPINDVFDVPMSAAEIESQRKELRIQRIRHNLRETRKQHDKIIKDSAEIKSRLRRLDEEAELRTRLQLAALRSPYLPIRPASAVPSVRPPPLPPLVDRRHTVDVPPPPRRSPPAPPTALPIPPIRDDQNPPIDVLQPQRQSSTQDRRCVDNRQRSPFFTDAKSDHVTFSLPANTQKVLGAIKKNYPAFLTMATQIFNDPKVNKEKIAEAFLRAMERRADLYEGQARRIQGSLEGASEERRQKLTREIAIINRQYQQTVHRINALCAELECDRVRSSEDRPSPHHAHRHLVAGSRTNQLRILQRVFEKA